MHASDLEMCNQRAAGARLWLRVDLFRFAIEPGRINRLRGRSVQGHGRRGAREERSGRHHRRMVARSMELQDHHV